VRADTAADDMHSPLIRWAHGDDAALFSSVVRCTQHVIYTSITSHDEIDAVQDGRVPMRKTREHRRLEPIGLFVAEVDGQVVGGANLVLLREGDTELPTMYVLPEYEGHGIGRAMGHVPGGALPRWRVY
jgi:GNAT superfamily N-acetyltransferase